MANKNPAHGSRVSCDLVPAVTHETNTRLTVQVQRLIAVHAIRPAIAATVATIVFGGGANG